MLDLVGTRGCADIVIESGLTVGVGLAGMSFPAGCSRRAASRRLLLDGLLLDGLVIGGTLLLEVRLAVDLLGYGSQHEGCVLTEELTASWAAEAEAAMKI